MKQMSWREWVLPYVLPVLALLGSLGVMFLFSDDPDMVWIFVIAPAIAVLTAFAVPPERAWVAPLAVALLLATAIVVGALFDVLEPRGPAVLAYLYLTVFVALPLTFFTWLGTALGTVYRDWRENRRLEAEWRHNRPSSPAGPRA